MKLTNIEKKSDLSYFISLDRNKDPNQRFLLLSDLHIDNPKCDRKLVLKVLREAKEQNAIILIFGDLFCLMQGKGDPRRSKADIRPEHNKPNYIDAVIKDTAEILKPFANNIALIADGNHETSIIKHIEVDPIDYLLNYLHKYNPDIQHGGYQGFVRLNTFAKENKSNVKNIDIFFHHGAWGSAVTKGTLSVNRYASIVKSDVVVSGHTHDTWYVEHPYYEMRKSGEVIQKTQYHIKTGTFKQEYLAAGGFQIEKQVMPKPLGGWWMDVQNGRGSDPARLNFTKAD